jgi:phage terminase large subunit
MQRIKIPDPFRDLLRPARYKVYYGGRGSAKSWSFATVLLAIAAHRPLRILCGREIQLSIADSVKRLLDDRIDALDLSGFYTSTNNEIVGANGSVFLFAGLKHNVTKIKSVEGVDVAWLEEGDRISRESLDILIPTIRKPGSEIWITFNPNEPTDPVYGDFVLADPPRTNAIVRKVNYEDNPFFPEVLREEMEWDRAHDNAKYLHVWEGRTRQRPDSLVMRNWRVEEFETPPNVMFLFGTDWGFSIDPTCLVRLWVDEDARRIYIDHEAWKVHCEIEDLPALFDTVPGSRDWLITADSQRPDTISYMQGQGFQIWPAKKGAGSVQDGIEFVNSYETLIHPRCKHTIDEFCSYRFKTNPQTDQITPLIEDKNNHTVDAVRYGLEAMRGARAGVW